MLPQLAPMLAIRASRPFHRAGWIYEDKVDGWRMFALKDGARVQLISRRGIDHTSRFRELAAAVGKLRPDRLVLDGEVAVYDQRFVSQLHLLGEPDPQVVTTPPLFMAFDCLGIGDRDLRAEPLSTRRSVLEDVIDGAELIFPVRRLPDDGLAAWEAVKEQGYEGLVAKDDRSRYVSGESRSWIKVKVRHEREFVVGGIGTARDGRLRLLVGEQVNGDLVFRGTVELGVGPALVTELVARSGRRDVSPFSGDWGTHGVVWLEPITKVEINHLRPRGPRLAERTGLPRPDGERSGLRAATPLRSARSTGSGGQ